MQVVFRIENSARKVLLHGGYRRKSEWETEQPACWYWPPWLAELSWAAAKVSINLGRRHSSADWVTLQSSMTTTTRWDKWFSTDKSSVDGGCMGHVMAPTVSESGGPNELDTENGRAGPSLSLLIGRRWTGLAETGRTANRRPARRDDNKLQINYVSLRKWYSCAFFFCLVWQSDDLKQREKEREIFAVEQNKFRNKAYNTLYRYKNTFRNPKNPKFSRKAVN